MTDSNPRAPVTEVWAHLVRLGGVNLRLPVTRARSGRSCTVMVHGRRYRIDALALARGETQIRDGWAFAPWDERAEAHAQAEADWQT